MFSRKVFNNFSQNPHNAESLEVPPFVLFYEVIILNMNIQLRHMACLELTQFTKMRLKFFIILID